MADAVQLASALTSLIGATCVVVEYVKKFCESQKSARKLYDRVRALSALLDTIRPVVDSVDRQSFRSAPNDQTQQLKQGIQGCLEGCERSIKVISNRLSGLVDSKTGNVKTRLSFVFGDGGREIEAHKATVEGHIQSLQLSLIALNGLNDNVNHATTHQFLHELLQLLAYLIVTQRQYQQHPATMGLRRHNAVAPPSLLLSNGTEMRMLPSIENPERNIEYYINSTAGLRNQPVPVPPQISQSTQGTDSGFNDRMQEISEDNDETNNAPSQEEAVIDAPLAIAVKHNQPAILQTLIHQGQDVRGRDAEGWTLIHHAVAENAYDALIVLLQSTQVQATNLVDAQNSKKQTALMSCAIKAERVSSLKLAKALIDHGADVNIEDASGRTALHQLVLHVANRNREAFAEMLVENGGTFGLDCRHIPGRADDYDAVYILTDQLRRASSAVPGDTATDPGNTSLSLTESSPDGDVQSKSRKFSLSSIKRRFSSASGFAGDGR